MENLESKLRIYKNNSNMDLWGDRLSHIENDYIKTVTSILLENQRLSYEVAKEQYSDEIKEQLYQIIIKVIPNLLIFKLASVQPFMGPNGQILYQEYTVEKDDKGEIIYDVNQVIDRLNGVDTVREEFKYERMIHTKVETQIYAKTRFLKTKFDLNNVDAISKNLIREINLEHLTDMWDNCGTISKKSGLYEGCYYSGITQLSAYIHRKTIQYKKYWIVVNPKTYDENKDILDRCNNCNSLYIGCLHIVDDWNHDGVLMGAFGKEFYQRAYVWCPYVFLQPILEDHDGFPIMTRYGKFLQKTGAKSYGKIINAE